MAKTFWEIAQEGERAWWGDCSNTWEEEQKQVAYSEKMELAPLLHRDLSGKAILDIGGGPVSMLLKCKNFARAKVVDPMPIPEWVKQRYSEARIEYEQIKGEDIDELGWDEVWIYNVLLHVENPERVIEKAKAAGKTIRVFEWINTARNDMHPHVFTKGQLDEWLGCDGKVENITYGNRYRTESYAAVVDKGLTSDPSIPGPPAPSGANIRHKRFHLLGLPHVPTMKGPVLACAFTQKVIKMARMLKSSGHQVFFYGVEGSTVECDEFMPVSTLDIIKESYGDYDMTKETYRHSPTSKATQVFNENAIIEIQKRMQPDDFLLIPFSPVVYKTIIDTLSTSAVDSLDKLHSIVEMGIGYRGGSCRFRVYESYAQLQYDSGLQNATDGDWYHVVIPNYFDPADFDYSDKKEDYFLYLGRVVIRKGIAVATRTVDEIGSKLIIAGQLAGENIDLSSANVEYVGFADENKRRKLLSGAKAVFLPTEYFEPFGGVAIEAAFSGTPVITSDWGAFSETVIHGKTGYRCRTLDQFVWAANNVDSLRSFDCRKHAMDNYSMDRVKWMYEEYFNMVLDVKENIDNKGWKRIHSGRTDLDWLKKYM
jgi:glycosyltransferase involved in cell wall biosynthesis